jgi:hypothetical protein
MASAESTRESLIDCNKEVNVNRLGKQAMAALQEYKCANAQIVLSLLGELAREYPEIRETVQSSLKKYKVSIPLRCPFDASSSSSSVATGYSGYSSRYRYTSSSSIPAININNDRNNTLVSRTLGSTNQYTSTSLPLLGKSMPSRGVAVKQTNMTLNV